MVLDDIGDNLTPTQVALDLNCSEHYLAVMRVNGSGPPYLKVRNLIRYPLAMYKAWLAEQVRTQTDGRRRGQGRKAA